MQEVTGSSPVSPIEKARFRRAFSIEQERVKRREWSGQSPAFPACGGLAAGETLLLWSTLCFLFSGDAATAAFAIEKRKVDHAPVGFTDVACSLTWDFAHGCACPLEVPWGLSERHGIGPVAALGVLHPRLFA